MNIKEWQTSCEENWFSVDHKYDVASREIQKSLKYNPDPKATVRHHLRDTEEQRKYNDEHYEMWGFNLDGTFEYGKYMIFMTEEDHIAIHNQSDETKAKRKETLNTPETKKKLSDAGKRVWLDKDYRSSMCKKRKLQWTEDRKNKKSESMRGELNHQYGKSGELSPNYGITRSDETRAKMSASTKEAYSNGTRERYRIISEDEHTKRSQAASGENNGMYGKHHTEESRNKMSQHSARSFLGKHHTDEAKLKIGEAHKKENLTDSTRQLLSDSSKKVHELRKSAFNNYVKEFNSNITYKEFSSLYRNNRWKKFLNTQ